MSPENRRTFEAEWPELSRRLNAFLARKGVGTDRREDLVQETGTRLIGMWTSVDLTKSPWALALTIALNLVRDGYRKGSDREIASEVPDVAEVYDLEQAGLARVELARIKSAMESLTASQRQAVLAEIGYGNGIHRRDSSADKMMRSRARRKLYTLIGRASAAASLQLRRLGEFAQAIIGSGDALQGMGCAACALLALGGVFVPHARAIDLAQQHTRSHVLIAAFDYGKINRPLELGGAASRALAPAGDDYLRRDVRARRSSTPSSTMEGGGTSASQQDPLPLPEPPLRRGDGIPQPPPAPEPQRKVGGLPKPPPLPVRGGDDVVARVERLLPHL